MRWLNEQSRTFLERGYLLPGQTPEERIEQIANKAQEYLQVEWFKEKFMHYMAQGYFSLSSPVWANYGVERGLPISCFGSYVPDSMPGILATHAEVGMMTKYGGGTTGFFWDLRPRGASIKDNGASSWPVHFMKMYETLVDVVSQGSVRRGSFAAYLPADHPDIMEFLDIRSDGNPIQNLNFAVTVSNQFMEDMTKWDKEKRSIWAKIIQRRNEWGQPYILFTDNANDGAPDIYRDKDIKIQMSNLCSEIMLPVNEEESFVCCLSSMNLEYYDEWKDTDAVQIMTFFLDAVLQDFIDKLKSYENSEKKEYRIAYAMMERALNFAIRHRAIGVWVFGWHSYLQSKMIPFESKEAIEINKEIFRFMKDHTLAASAFLAKQLGESFYTKWYGRRNTTTMAIAPTTSSAFIIWQASQSIEPFFSNCYVKDLAKMKITVKNKYLEQLLKSKWKDTKEVWNSIRDADGSVLHLDFLSDHEKNVFKTFSEISQYTIIDQAADRQRFIDQWQSLNLMINPNTPIKEINALYIDAWAQGIKSLYYQHSKSAAQELSRKIVCAACEA